MAAGVTTRSSNSGNGGGLNTRASTGTASSQNIPAPKKKPVPTAQTKKKPMKKRKTDDSEPTEEPPKKQKISGLSAEEEALFQELEKKRNQRTKQLNDKSREAKKNKVIAARNLEMVEREEIDDTEDASAGPRKTKKSATTASTEEEEDEDITNALGPIPVRSLAPSNTSKSQANDYQGSDDDMAVDGDEDEPGDTNETGDDDEPEEEVQIMERADSVSTWDNGMSISSGSTKSSASTTTSMSTPRKSNSRKVKESDFTPRTMILAAASKTHIRSKVIFEGPFSSENRTQKLEFTWEVIKDVGAHNINPDTKDAYKRACQQSGVKKNLIEFTGYGRIALMSGIVTLAREHVKSFYGLSGSPEKIKVAIDWLLTDATFMFGEVNLENQTCNANKPFGCELIKEIISAQWFPNSKRAKQDSQTTDRILKEKIIPIAVIILVVTAIEHSLKEWTIDGKHALINFTEEMARNSYDHHMGNWAALEEGSRKWTTFHRRQLFKNIMENYNKAPRIPSKMGKDLARVDFSALQALVPQDEEDGADIEGDAGGNEIYGEKIADNDANAEDAPLQTANKQAPGNEQMD